MRVCCGGTASARHPTADAGLGLPKGACVPTGPPDPLACSEPARNRRSVPSKAGKNMRLSQARDNPVSAYKTISRAYELTASIRVRSRSTPPRALACAGTGAARTAGPNTSAKACARARSSSAIPAARPRSAQAGHAVIGNAAGNDAGKMPELGRHVDGDAVEADPVAQADADRRDLVLGGRRGRAAGPAAPPRRRPVVPRCLPSTPSSAKGADDPGPRARRRRRAHPPGAGEGRASDRPRAAPARDT